MPHLNEEKRTLSRRDALKTLAAITGAVTLASLPSNWQTPVVHVGALPAHAQCSIESGTFTFDIVNNSSQPYTLRLTGGGYDNSVTAPANGGTACMTGIPVGVELAVTETFCGSTGRGTFIVPEEFADTSETLTIPEFICGTDNADSLVGSMF